MSSRRGRHTEYDVPWDNIQDDRVYRKGHQGNQNEYPLSNEYKMDAAANSFGQRSSTGRHPQYFNNRSSRHSSSSKYEHLVPDNHSESNLFTYDYTYDNPAFLSHDQFPAGRYQRTRQERSEGCRRPCIIGAVIVIVLVLLAGVGVGLYFGVFREEEKDIKTTLPPDPLIGFSAELRLADQTWDPGLQDNTSPQFIAMKNDVQSDIDKIMTNSSLTSQYRTVEVLSFRQGSVIVITIIRMLSRDLSASSFRTIFVQSYNNIDRSVLRVTKAVDISALNITVTQSTSVPPTTTAVQRTSYPTTITTTAVQTTTITQSTTMDTGITSTAPQTSNISTTPAPAITPTSPSTSTPRIITPTNQTTTVPPSTAKPSTTTSTNPRQTASPTSTTTTTPRQTTTSSPTATTIPRQTTTSTSTTTTTPRQTTTSTSTTTTTPRQTTTTSTSTTTTTPRQTTTSTSTTTTTPRQTTTSTSTTTTTRQTTTSSTTSTSPRQTTTSPPATTSTPGPTTTSQSHTTITLATTTTGFTTPAICRNNTEAIIFLPTCFDTATFNSFTTDMQRCEYLEGVGNCTQSRMETKFNVECSRADQIFLLNLNANLIQILLGFDIITKCNFQRR